jgi:hypothetical protein
MFSKEEAKKLRQDFWISFGKSFPRKWILYNTGIKDCAFKFHFDLKSAMVSMDIESQDLEKRLEVWEKLILLRSIHNKNTWRETMEFLKDNMAIIEDFYNGYEDIIKP